MRLADFIAGNVELILTDWESFARSIWPGETMAEPVELRDSAEQILRAIVADINTAQSEPQRQSKSAGRGDGGTASDRLDHASTVHGADRVGSGLSLLAVIAEYRALRASVLRLWQTSVPSPDLHDLDDITRFNEALDQSLAVAIASYTRRIDRSRKLFLGVLGHDLRNPLAAITLMAKLASLELAERPDLAHPAATAELQEQLGQITASADVISTLLGDLIDFTSSSMGVSMQVAFGHCDLRAVCDDVCREIRAAFPGRSINTSFSGDVAGTWDAHRLRQVVSNLLSNALQHSPTNEPVRLTGDGTAADTVVLTIHNGGRPIPADVLPTIFDPLVRGPTSVEHRRTPGSVGLGLYIVKEIATAHGGTAALTSTAAAGTSATIRLPRHAGKPA